MAGDDGLILAIAGPSNLVAGGLQDVDDPFIKVTLGWQCDPNGVNDRTDFEILPGSWLEIPGWTDEKADQFAGGHPSG